jgi:hypothetical protein
MASPELLRWETTPDTVDLPRFTLKKFHPFTTGAATAHSGRVAISKTRLTPGIFLLLAGLWPAAVWAHDPLEISATVSLRTNRVEMTVVMMRKTIMRVAEHQSVHLLDFSRPEERDEAMPVLRTQGAGLFDLNCGTNRLATPAEVIIGNEDHVGFKLNYALPATWTTNDTLRFDAKLLGHLPADEGYGVSVVVLDLVDNKVVEQKLLNASDPVFQFALPPPATPTNATPVE